MMVILLDVCYKTGEACRRYEWMMSAAPQRDHRTTESWLGLLADSDVLFQARR